MQEDGWLSCRYFKGRFFVPLSGLAVWLLCTDEKLHFIVTFPSQHPLARQLPSVDTQTVPWIQRIRALLYVALVSSPRKKSSFCSPLYSKPSHSSQPYSQPSSTPPPHLSCHHPYTSKKRTLIGPPPQSRYVKKVGQKGIVCRGWPWYMSADNTTFIHHRLNTVNIF